MLKLPLRFVKSFRSNLALCIISNHDHPLLTIDYTTAAGMYIFGFHGGERPVRSIGSWHTHKVSKQHWEDKVKIMQTCSSMFIHVNTENSSNT